jgi:hypothetical protein
MPLKVGVFFYLGKMEKNLPLLVLFLSPIEGLWRHCSYSPLHSLTGPVGQLFASHPVGSGSCPWHAPKLTMEPGSPVSNV